MSKLLSFVIPCYRCENTITNVVDEIKTVVASLGDYEYEIITVDDCSPDNSIKVLKELADKDNNIKVVRFAKNFGQHAGLIAGVNYTKGDIVVYLDDDGQCPVDRLKEMIAPIEADTADIAIAQYGRKTQSVFKNICSVMNEFSANILIDKPKDIQIGNFVAFRRFIADEVVRYKGPYPYMLGLLFRSSKRIVNVPMKDRKRQDGETTYTVSKLFALWINSFTAFSIKPLRIAVVLGALLAICGLIYGTYVVMRALFTPIIVYGWSSLMAVMLVIGGMILFVLGIIGEYIGRIYMSLNNTPQFVVKELYNLEENNK